MRFFYSNVASSPRIGLHAIGIAQGKAKEL